MLKLKKITFGTLVETPYGIGTVVKVGLKRIKVDITHPVARGRVDLRPREVLREIENASTK